MFFIINHNTFISLFCLIRMAEISTQRKRYGVTESPCQQPRSTLNCLDMKPYCKTEALKFEFKILTQSKIYFQNQKYIRTL
jgi:hypothetical protein